MKTLKQFINEEGVAANAVGSGNIAGVGVGPDGEPGVGRRTHRKHKRKIKRGRRLIGFGYMK